MFKVRIFIAILSAAFGVTIITSEPSYAWHMYKYDKQNIDCINDIDNRVMEWMSQSEHGSLGKEWNAMGGDFNSCVKGIDFNKSSIKFLEEQHKRNAG